VCDIQHFLAITTTRALISSMPIATVSRNRLLILAALLVGISLCHYFTPVHLDIFHQIFRRLYYIPVIFGAWWFGFRGGMVTAAVSTILWLPPIIFQWGHVGTEAAGQYGEIVMFVVVGAITGILADRERRLLTEQQEAARELEAAYQRLQDSLEQIRRADRLSAIGQLSAGLAHEIRNPLGSIRGAADLLLDELPDDHPSGEFMDIIRKETARLQHLLDDLLSYARPSSPAFAEVAIGSLVEHVFRLLGKEAERNGLRLESRIPADFPAVMADEGQLSQVFVNLVLNAIQSSGSGGMISVSAYEHSGNNSVHDDSIHIVIEDEGPGIPEADIELLFDPFHTTRDEGTGLGLSVVHSIMETHGGGISAANREDGGARFTMTLPIRQREDSSG